MDEFNNYNDVSYKSVPEDDECVLNAVQVGKIIGEPASTIRVWADLHGEFLYIKKINGRFVYTQASISQFQFIQTLVREKGFTHDLVREQLRKHGFEYAKYSGGIVNPEDPLGFEALATQIMLKNQEQLKQFMIMFMESQKNFKDELKSEIKEEVAIAVDEHMDNKLDEFKTYLDQRELEQKQRDIEMIDSLKTHMEDTKKKIEEEQSRGFWSKMFKK